jgi:hypothetical protein
MNLLAVLLALSPVIVICRGPDHYRRLRGDGAGLGL